MNEILSVGLILVAALVAGHLAQIVRVPEVTGYLLIGVLIGPAALDLISQENLTTLAFLSEELFQFLIVTVQGTGPILQLLVLSGEGRLFFLEVFQVALENHRTIGAAGQSDHQ